MTSNGPFQPKAFYDSSSWTELHSRFSLPPPTERRRGTGNGGRGQFTTRCLCCSFPLRGRTPHTLPCSSTGSLSQETVLHKPLQRGSLPRGAILQEQAAPAWVPTGSQALPVNLLWCGLLSPWGHRSWQEPAPAQALHRVTASFRHPPAPAWAPPLAAGGDLLHRGPPWAAEAQPASPWSAPQAAGENLCSGAWSTSSLFSSDLDVCRAVCLTSSSSSLQLQFPFCSFFPFLTMLSQRHYHR